MVKSRLGKSIWICSKALLTATLALALPAASAATLTYTFEATLVESYGTAPSGQSLSGTLKVNDGSPATVISVEVTEGKVETGSGPINVFDNGFGGGTDAIGIQGLSPTGSLGGIIPGNSSSIIVDLRGPNTVISNGTFPADIGTLNAFDQRTLLLPAPNNPDAVTGVASIGPFALAGAGIYTFNATLLENYGSIPSEQPLTGILTVDLNTGMVSSLIVSTGLVKTSGGPINVFNNAFTDGATDAIGIQGLSPTGNFGGIVPGGSSSVIVDLRGPNTVINDTAFPTDAGTLNAFPQRTLGLPAPSNPNAVTGVATIGPLSLVGSSTPGGAEVEVVLTPTLENGSTTNIALSFGTVTTEGTTSVSVSTEGPPPPGGVIISGQTVFYDIKTTAVTSGPVEICLSYDDSGLDPQAEQNLTLWHFEEPAVGDPFWVNITREGDPDTVNNIICGVTSSFSAFTIFQVNPDSDNDGLTDEDEIVWGTDPNNPDTDQDGLLDGTEVDIAQGTGCPNPLTVDSDGDGISDGAEVGAGTNPCNVDTDGDSIPDNIDPFPTVPEEDVAGFVEAWLRDLSNLVHSFDLSTIAAKNDNAARGRRNAMSNKLDSAANSIAVGDTAAAIDQLSSLFQKLDGEPSPGDWMGDSPQRNDLRNQIGLILGLLAG